MQRIGPTLTFHSDIKLSDIQNLSTDVRTNWTFTCILYANVFTRSVKRLDTVEYIHSGIIVVLISNIITFTM